MAYFAWKIEIFVKLPEKIEFFENLSGKIEKVLNCLKKRNFVANWLVKIEIFGPESTTSQISNRVDAAGESIGDRRRKNNSHIQIYPREGFTIEKDER